MAVFLIFFPLIFSDYENRFLEYAGDTGKIDHTDSGGDEKVPGNEAETEVESVRSLVESVFSDLLNTRVNSDETQPINSNQSSLMEKFITDLEALLNKVSIYILYSKTLCFYGNLARED